MPPTQTEISIFLADERIDSHLLDPGEYVIGSSPEAQIRFPAEDLAPCHARLTLRVRDSIIQDLDSPSGTFVDGHRVRHIRVVADGHRIQIAGRTISLRRIENAGFTDGDATHCGATVSLAPESRTEAVPQDARKPVALPKPKYKIGRVVDAGGMGAILDAFETATERHVAMKVMANPEKADYARFMLEARITAQLEHPNIVPVHELAINEDGSPFYTMKLVQGVSLRKVLEMLALGDPETIASYPLDALLTILQKVCDAVAFAHSKGILHRDLKPENIMLGQYGEALVMDWGLAKLLEERGSTNGGGPVSIDDSGAGVLDIPADGATLKGMILGTPNYMPPEQARGEIDRLDMRSDIYSLGAILYHFLTLEAPVVGKTVNEVLGNVRAGKIESPRKAIGTKRHRHLPGGQVPESLAAVAMKALEREPDARYATVANFQREIRSYQTGFATMAEKAGAWRLFKLFFFRKLALNSAIAIVVIAGIVFLSYMASETREANRQRDSAQARLYVSHMAQVREEIENGRPQSAYDLLRRHRPRPGEKDSRGWEWYYALGQLNRDGIRNASAHRNGAFALVASPDGSLLASGGGDGEIVIWDPRGLVPTVPIHAADDAVFALAWDRSASLLASGGSHGRVRVWDVKSGRQRAETSSPDAKAVRALSWNSSKAGDPMLAFGGPGADIYLWHPLAQGAEGEPRKFFHTELGASGLDWSLDGAKLGFGSVGLGRSFNVLDSRGQSIFAEEPTHEAGTDIRAVAIDPTGRYIAVGSKHRLVTVFEIETNKVVFTETLHSESVNALAWSPEGDQLASAGDDGAIKTVSPLSVPSPGETPPVRRVLSGYHGRINAIVWMKLAPRDGEYGPVSLICSADAEGGLREWVIGNENEISGPKDGAVSAARWSADGRQIAIADFSPYIKIVDPQSLASYQLRTPARGINDVEWSPTADRVAAISRDPGNVEVIDAVSGRLLSMYALPNAIRVEWSSSGRYLAACSADLSTEAEHAPSQVTIWDLQLNQVVFSSSIAAGSVIWSRDEKMLFIGGSDGSIRVLDISAGKLVRDLKPASAPYVGAIGSKYEPPRQVFDLAVSPDEKRLAYVTEDGQAAVIDLASGQVCPLSGASSGLRRVVWNEDGKRIAICGTDGRLQVYDAAEGMQLAMMVHGNGKDEIQALDWRRDGDQIMTGGWDGKVRIWDGVHGKQVDAAERHIEEGFVSLPGADKLRDYAQQFMELGWTDSARQYFALASRANPNSSPLSGAAGKLANALSAKKSSPDAVASSLLDDMYSNWKDDRDAALDEYRKLSRLPVAARWLPLAQRNVSACSWNVKWFNSTSNSAENADAWQKSAESPAAIQVEDLRTLSFPYHKHGPRGLGLNDQLTASGPEARNCGMIASSQLLLPAGKWRLQNEGDGGVRIYVNNKLVVDSMTTASSAIQQGIYDQQQSGNVQVTIEHFAKEPCEGFEFLLIPVLE